MTQHTFVLSRRVDRELSLAERALTGLTDGDYAGLRLAGPFERRTIVGLWGSGPAEREAPADLRTGRRMPERVDVELAPWARRTVELRVTSPGAPARPVDPTPAAPLLRARAPGDRRAGPRARARDARGTDARTGPPHRLNLLSRERTEPTKPTGGSLRAAAGAEPAAVATDRLRERGLAGLFTARDVALPELAFFGSLLGTAARRGRTLACGHRCSVPGRRAKSTSPPSATLPQGDPGPPTLGR